MNEKEVRISEVPILERKDGTLTVKMDDIPKMLDDDCQERICPKGSYLMPKEKSLLDKDICIVVKFVFHPLAKKERGKKYIEKFTLYPNTQEEFDYQAFDSFYHVSDLKNKDNILINGLIAKKENQSDLIEGVWFTVDPPLAETTRGLPENVVVFKVKIDNIPKERTIYCYKRGGGYESYEWLVDGDIPPESIDTEGLCRKIIEVEFEGSLVEMFEHFGYSSDDFFIE
jgi:hypothetical protein